MKNLTEGLGPGDLPADHNLLRVDVDDHAAAQVVVFGELDIATIGVLRDALSSANPSPSSETVTIDLSAVTFISSCGLALLLHAHRDAERAGSRIALRHAAPCVQRLLEISGCEHIFHRD